MCVALTLVLLTAPGAELRFEDAAAAWGVDFIGTTAGPPYDDVSKVNGGGVAVGDVDADGRPDVYVARTGANLLYLHRGDHFEEVGEAWGVADAGRGAGAVLVDLTGDAFPELLLTNFGPDRAWVNRGDRFEPMDGFDDDGMGMGLGVADFDDDGFADVYVARYVEWPEVVPREGGPCQWKGVPVLCGPEAYRPQGDLFYRGGSDGALIPGTPWPADRPGRGMGVAVVRLDDDPRPDLYVANDASDNFAFQNHPDGPVERALPLGLALSAVGLPEAGMGVGPGDLDGDGREDLVVTNFDGQTHSLYLARSGWFEESATPRGVGRPSLPRLSWGVQAEDFDHDGDLDLHVVNGHLYENAAQFGASWKQPDDLFVNDGTGRFAPLPDGWDGVAPGSGRGSAVLDVDQDGRLDLLVWNLGDPARLLLNRTETGSFVRVRLRAADGTPEATLCGARVRLHAGDTVQTRTFRRGGSYLSANEAPLHFGLGETNADSVVVEWPYRGRTVVRDVPRDTTLEIRR